LVRLTDRLPDNAKVYVDFYGSGFVIWRAFARGVRVFYDLRNDCFSPQTATDFFAIREGSFTPEETREALERRGTEFALVSERWPIHLPSDGRLGWAVLAHDGVWTLWGRLAANPARAEP
jgi:hypothetical protein